VSSGWTCRTLSVTLDCVPLCRRHCQTTSSPQLAESAISVSRTGSIYGDGQKGFWWRGYMPKSCAGALGVTVAAGQDGRKGGDGRGDGLHGETLTDLIHR
jgi:hypothetical protein